MNCLDSRFKYTPALHSDIRKTFDRVRAERAAADLPKALPRLLHLQASAYGKKEKKT